MTWSGWNRDSIIGINSWAARRGAVSEGEVSEGEVSEGGVGGLRGGFRKLFFALIYLRSAVCGWGPPAGA